MRQVRDSLDQEMLGLTLSASGEITQVNALFFEELAFSEEDVLGKKLIDLVPQD